HQPKASWVWKIASSSFIKRLELAFWLESAHGRELQGKGLHKSMPSCFSHADMVVCPCKAIRNVVRTLLSIAAEGRGHGRQGGVSRLRAAHLACTCCAGLITQPKRLPACGSPWRLRPPPLHCQGIKYGTDHGMLGYRQAVHGCGQVYNMAAFPSAALPFPGTGMLTSGMMAARKETGLHCRARRGMPCVWEHGEDAHLHRTGQKELCAAHNLAATIRQPARSCLSYPDIDGNNLQEYGTSIPPSTGQSSQHAATVTGQQALHDLSVECRVLSTHLPCLTGPMPDHSSTPHTQRYPLTDAPVSKTSIIAALSDVPDLDDSSDGAGIVHRKRLPSAARHFAAHEHGPGQPASPCETSQASAESSYHGTVSGSLLQHHLNQSPSPDSRHSRGPARFGGSGEQDRGAGGGAEVEAESPRKCPDIPERRQNGSPSTLSIPSSDVAVTPQPSLNTDSNVSVSFSDSLHEPRSPGGGAPPPGRNGTPCMGRRTPEDTVQPGGPPSSNPEHRLSLGGLFYLLDSIEEHLPARDTELYSSPAVCEQKLRDIISRSDGHCRIRREELASCGAVVLQQLPCLARSMPQRCLLPSSLVHTYWSTDADAAQIRSCLAGDSALLWERWLTHVCRLLRLDVLPLERALRLFTPLLVCEGASYTDKVAAPSSWALTEGHSQAEELLKRLLTHVAETGLSSESEESSSCSLPSLLRDGPEIRPGRHSKNPATQEVQSGEEDSADQSPVESIPIRETKAYQLLKQSVTQETQQKSRQEEEEENNASDLEPSGQYWDECRRRKDPKRKVQAFSAVQSKEFAIRDVQNKRKFQMNWN
ncbi:hypothetical protein P4O66_011940, partial [Electrophorus voltai]